VTAVPACVCYKTWAALTEDTKSIREAKQIWMTEYLQGKGKRQRIVNLIRKSCWASRKSFVYYFRNSGSARVSQTGILVTISSNLTVLQILQKSPDEFL
jgi:hypothetical protein